MKNLIVRFSVVCMTIILTACSNPPEEAKSVNSSDGVEISHTDDGNGSPALVFVHGWSCDKTYWREQVQFFAERFRVVSIDLAGHGQSGHNRENFTMESFGDDVVAVVNGLNLEKVILIGHSMGALVIIDAAGKLPGKVEAVVGIDMYETLVDTSFTQEMRDQFIAPFYTDFPSSVHAFVQTMFPPHADSALVATISADMASAPKNVAMSAFENLFNYSTRMEEILKTIDLPFYAINSDKYPTQIEENRKYVKSFEAKIIEGIGHFPMLENPDLFNGLLIETINDILKPDADIL